MKLLLRVLKLCIAAYVLMTGAMLLWTFTWSEPDLETLAPADAIFCLGAGMGPNGDLDPAAVRRVERCVETFNAGVAPLVVFSGGRAMPDGPSAGHQMAIYAQTLGLPQTAVIKEENSYSTLQNALFSLPLIPQADSIIVVTEAFHLPRAAASFRWAAAELGQTQPNITLVLSEQVRRSSNGTGIGWRVLARESLAIWFNIARALAYSIAPNATADWLR